MAAATPARGEAVTMAAGLRVLLPEAFGIVLGVAALISALPAEVGTLQAPYFEALQPATEATFETVKGAKGLLPPAPAEFEVVHKMKISAMGGHDAGYGGGLWVRACTGQHFLPHIAI